MGQRARILTEIFGFDGWKVKEAWFEDSAGQRVWPVAGFSLIRGTRLVLGVERRWLPRCGPFHLMPSIPFASITGTFCPTCRTYYEGGCWTKNGTHRDDHTVSYDVDCELQNELSGELRVSAHIENGPILLVP